MHIACIERGGGGLCAGGVCAAGAVVASSLDSLEGLVRFGGPTFQCTGSSPGRLTHYPKSLTTKQIPNSPQDVRSHSPPNNVYWTASQHKSLSQTDQFLTLPINKRSHIVRLFHASQHSIASQCFTALLTATYFNVLQVSTCVRPQHRILHFTLLQQSLIQTRQQESYG